MQDIWAKLGRIYDLDILEHDVSVSRPLCFSYYELARYRRG